MATDEELAERHREHKKARRRYLGYRWFTFGLFLCLFMPLAVSLDPLMPDSAWGRAISIGALAGVTMFLADWISAVVFKRKSRPWHLHRHPEDNDPRKRRY